MYRLLAFSVVLLFWGAARAEPPVRTGSLDRPRPDPHAGALRHPFERGPRDLYGQARVNLALQRPAVTIQTSVSVPSGGSVLVGGYSSLSSGSRGFGPPLAPGRPFANSGQGYSASSQRIYLRARIIDLREEEERQTGVSR
jgi:hypothetical protein